MRIEAQGGDGFQLGCSQEIMDIKLGLTWIPRGRSYGGWYFSSSVMLWSEMKEW